MITCPHCRHKNNDWAKVCTDCGKVLPDKVVNFNQYKENYQHTNKGTYNNTNQLLGIVGSIMLFIGVFAPIVSIPIIGNINYFQNGKGDGVLVLILAAISLFAALIKRYNWLLLTGIGSLVIMVITFINFQSKMSETREAMQKELAGNPFAGLGEVALQTIQIQWGVALLIIGALLVIAAAFVNKE